MENCAFRGIEGAGIVRKYRFLEKINIFSHKEQEK